MFGCYPTPCPTTLRSLARGGGQALKELSKVEQRYDAVVAVIRGGMAVTEVAQKFGVFRTATISVAAFAPLPAQR